MHIIFYTSALYVYSSVTGLTEREREHLVQVVQADQKAEVRGGKASSDDASL